MISGQDFRNLGKAYSKIAERYDPFPLFSHFCLEYEKVWHTTTSKSWIAFHCQKQDFSAPWRQSSFWFCFWVYWILPHWKSLVLHLWYPGSMLYTYWCVSFLNCCFSSSSGKGSSQDQTGYYITWEETMSDHKCFWIAERSSGYILSQGLTIW